MVLIILDVLGKIEFRLSQAVFLKGNIFLFFRTSDVDMTVGIVTIPTDVSIRDVHKNASPLKSHGQRRQKFKKHVSANTNDIGSGLNQVNVQTSGILKVEEETHNVIANTKAKNISENVPANTVVRIGRDKLQIVNE